MPRSCFLLCLCLCGATAALAAGIPDPIRIPSRPGAVTFSHGSHAGIHCQECHHTSRGAAVTQGCRGCHTQTSSFPRNSEKAFHDSCIGCHLKEKKAGQRTGPVKLCSQCHIHQAR